MKKIFSFLKPNQILNYSDYPEKVLSYASDWTKQFNLKVQGLLFPHSIEEVQKIILEANVENIKIVPSGGRTGLSGGAVASQNEWVLSLEKMNKIKSISPIEGTIEVEAGVVTKTLQEEALKNHLYFPVEFAATGSSLIGGNIATNAGGVHVVKYGNTREWVRSLTVVTGKGDVLKLNRGLLKNNSGYDLRQLFIASEGTLGVICEAEIELTSIPQEKRVIVIGLESLNSMLDCFAYTKKHLPLMAFEMFDALALEKVKKVHGLSSPLDQDCPYYVLMEVELSKGFGEDELEETLVYYFEKGWAQDGVLSASSAQYESLWKYRELISESISPQTPYKNDVSVKISKIPEFIDVIQKTVMSHHKDLEVLIFGHIGDGNLHVNTLRPDGMLMEDFVKKCESVNKILFKEIKRIGGSISAEHGVGLLKKPYLKYSLSAEELAYMKEIKKIFDPKSVLNPGKVFDLLASEKEGC